MKVLKKSFETVAVVIILLTSMSSSGNFTQPVLPASEEQGARTVHSGSSYYGNDDKNYFKKPPCQGGITHLLQNSFWMVPVLRYLVTVSGKGVSLRDEPLTVWLPVVLESAASWWFHEQQLEDQLSQRGEVIQGFPLPANQWPVNQPAEQEKKTGKRKSEEAAPGERKRIASRASPDNDNNQSSGDGNGHEDEIKHNCGSHSCPACNHAPCHCPQCFDPLNFREGFETPRARVWSGKTTHIVQMLAYRQVTGHFPVPETQLLSTLSQDRIQRYHPVAISKIPALADELCCDQTCKQLINLSDGRLIVLTIIGNCYVWSEWAGSWSFIRLEQFEPGLYSQLRSFATEVVVLPGNRIVLVDCHQIDEISRTRLYDIVLWTEQHDGWKFKVIASFEEAYPGSPYNELNTLTCLPDGGLLFLLSRHLLAMTEYNDEWSVIELSDEHTKDIAVLPDGRFITWQRIESQSQTIFLSTLSVWTKTQGLWLPSVIYRGEILLWAFIVDTRFNILTSTVRIFFEEINDEWKSTLQETWVYCRQYTTPDGRLAELSERSGCLAINIKHGRGWRRNEIIPNQLDTYIACGYPTESQQITEGVYYLWQERQCPGIFCNDLKKLLSDGRVVRTINRRHIQIWLEENGKWTSVNLPGIKEQYIVRLVELPEFRLAVIDITGAIRILNLMPGPQETRSVSEKKELDEQSMRQQESIRKSPSPAYV